MKNLLCTKFSLPRQKALTSSCVCSHPLLEKGKLFAPNFVETNACHICYEGCIRRVPKNDIR